MTSGVGFACFEVFRGCLRGPAAAGRPLRSMSPGIRLRRLPPPLLTRKGLPATAGLGPQTQRGSAPRAHGVLQGGGWGCPLVGSKGGGGGRRPTPGDMDTKGHPHPPLRRRISAAIRGEQAASKSPPVGIADLVASFSENVSCLKI